MAQLVKCLPCKCEDLSVISRIYEKTDRCGWGGETGFGRGETGAEGRRNRYGGGKTVWGRREKCGGNKREVWHGGETGVGGRGRCVGRAESGEMGLPVLVSVEESASL